MTSELKLLPCPFCGGEASLASVDDPRVTCRGPMACCGKQVATPAFAWNRRAPARSDAVARLVEAASTYLAESSDYFSGDVYKSDLEAAIAAVEKEMQ